MNRKMADRGFRYDSNLCAFLQTGLVPLRTATRIIRFPVFWEDDVHSGFGLPWTIEAIDEELRSPYVIGDETVDLSAWARDAIALALPDKILCRTDCAGLCPVCGKDLNAEPHAHEAPVPDSRWAALEALRADDAS